MTSKRKQAEAFFRQGFTNEDSFEHIAEQLQINTGEVVDYFAAWEADNYTLGYPFD